jgi:hypothetical protein
MIAQFSQFTLYMQEKNPMHKALSDNVAAQKAKYLSNCLYQQFWPKNRKLVQDKINPDRIGLFNLKCLIMRDFRCRIDRSFSP